MNFWDFLNFFGIFRFFDHFWKKFNFWGLLWFFLGLLKDFLDFKFFFGFLNFLNYFWSFFFCFLGFPSKLLFKVTTKSYQGYYQAPKIAKNGPKQYNKLFFWPKGQKSLSRRPKLFAGARSRPTSRAVSSSTYNAIVWSAIRSKKKYVIFSEQSFHF